MSPTDTRSQACERLERSWITDVRWRGIERRYSAEEVVGLRGSVEIEHSLARRGAEQLWQLVNGDGYVPALGAITGSQAVQMVKAGLRAIYLSGWQVAGDGNLAESTYPDQSLYPVNSVPSTVRRLSSEKKCGHLGGKVLVPTGQFIRTLQAARLAADVCDVPTVLVARTDALSARLLTSDVDERDRDFLTGERTPEGFFVVRDGLEPTIARALAYAPYADLVWFETSTPDLDEALEFAQAVHAVYPGKLLAYNCSPSFNWKRTLDDEQIASFQETLAGAGYKFQFVTLAGFHSIASSMFALAEGYAREGMPAYVRMQEHEFELEEKGYTATRHQREVGAGYFDLVAQAISGGQSSTLALVGSTEEAQFEDEKVVA